MRLVSEALGAVPASTSEVDGYGERSGTRGNVHRCSTSEVKAAEDEGPSIRVPCPARNGIVYQRRPEENEDEDGTNSRMLSERTNGKHRAEDSVIGDLFTHRRRNRVASPGAVPKKIRNARQEKSKGWREPCQQKFRIQQGKQDSVRAISRRSEMKGTYVMAANMSW